MLLPIFLKVFLYDGHDFYTFFEVRHDAVIFRLDFKLRKFEKRKTSLIEDLRPCDWARPVGIR